MVTINLQGGSEMYIFSFLCRFPTRAAGKGTISMTLTQSRSGAGLALLLLCAANFLDAMDVSTIRFLTGRDGGNATSASIKRPVTAPMHAAWWALREKC